MKILMIEDDLMVIKTIEKLLSYKEKHTLLITTNGLQAMPLAKNLSDINLIILDLLMPEMDGFEFLKIVRNDLKLKTKILVMSRINDSETKKKVISLGANAFLEKPINLNEFTETIENLLESDLNEL